MLKAVRSFLGQLPVEPSPRWGQFSAVDRHHYVWRGDGPRRRCNIIAVYNPSTELWSLLPTTGPLPPGEYGGCSVCAGRCLYTFGGDWDGSSYFNDMSKLDLDTLQWTKVQTFGSQPMKKRGCGLLRVNERTLCCFGGEGIEGSTQPGSTFTSALSDGRGRTNEFHFFDTQNGNFCQCAHSLYVFVTYTYRVSSYWWTESHPHSHRKPCSLSYRYKDDVTLYHSLNCPTPTSRCLVVP